ncbi:MAG: thioredoxin-dependent thiol peroxidase [Chitinophagales bacterium]
MKKAPAFTLPDETGRKVKLSDFSGKKVALYFYPKDDTPTCTNQACNLRDNYKLLQKQGYTILGISCDAPERHAKFKAKYKLPFTLLADEDHKVQEKYGVWQEKQLYGRKYMGTVRTTFLIDEKGRIASVIDKVKAADHAAQIIAAGAGEE